MKRKSYTMFKRKSHALKTGTRVKRVVPDLPSIPFKPSKPFYVDPLGLGRPDPSTVGLYDVIEGRDGNLYMNVSGRWVVPGTSNWAEARAYKRAPDDYFSGFRYNYPRGRVVDLPGYSYGPLGPY